jgi:thymidylate kinase
MSRIEAIRKAVEAQKEPVDVVLLERSIFSDTIFVQTLLEGQFMTDTEATTYKRLWDLWTVQMPFPIDAFVFLDTSPTTSNSRVRARDRKSETNDQDAVPLAYQERLRRFHRIRFCEDAVPTEAEEKHVQRFPFPAVPSFVVPSALADGDFRSGGSSESEVLDLLWKWVQSPPLSSAESAL